MKNLVCIAFLTLPMFALGQVEKVSAADSLKIMEAVDMTFDLFETPDFEKFKKSTTDEIYCSLCIPYPDLTAKDPNMLTREDFFNLHLTDLKGFEDFKRAKKLTHVFLVQENSRHSDITTYMRAWQKDEWQKGHEGSDLGFYFKRSGDGFVFAGIEVIP